MDTYFSEILDEIKLLANHELEGYDSEEISKIERLYDISIDKDFKSFLEFAGKCSRVGNAHPTQLLFILICRVREDGLCNISPGF